MKGKDIIVIGALAAGAYLLLGGNGIGGGIEGGGGKKATVLTGSLFDSAPTSAEQAAVSQPAIVQPSPARFSLFDQIGESLGLTNFKLNPDNTYSGTRDVSSKKYYVEGDLRTDLFGQMKLNPSTGQLYTTNTGGTGNHVLYTEKSKAINTMIPLGNTGRFIDPYAALSSSNPVVATKKESSSSSSSSSSSKSQNYSSQGGGSYSNSGFGGWG